MFNALLMLAVIGPTVTAIDDRRFRVGIVYDNTSPSGHADAQLALMKAAKKACVGKGMAISDGSLTLGNAAPIKGKRRALALSEIYSCQPRN
jgi:hypothetical protein